MLKTDYFLLVNIKRRRSATWPILQLQKKNHFLYGNRLKTITLPEPVEKNRNYRFEKSKSVFPAKIFSGTSNREHASGTQDTGDVTYIWIIRKSIKSSF